MAYVFQKRVLSRVTGDANVKVHCRRHARTCVMRAPAPHGAVCKVEPGRAQRAVFVSVADDAGVLFPINEERVAHARHAKEKVARRRQRALMRLHRAERERFFHVFEIWRDQNGQFVVLHGIVFFSGGRDYIIIPGIIFGGRDYIIIPDWSPHPSGLHVIRKMVGHAVRILVYH